MSPWKLIVLHTQAKAMVSNISRASRTGLNCPKEKVY